MLLSDRLYTTAAIAAIALFAASLAWLLALALAAAPTPALALLRAPWQAWPAWPRAAHVANLAAICVAAGVAFGFAVLMHNFRWDRSPRDLHHPYRLADLLALSVPVGAPRLFAGRFAGRDLHVSTQDRALVLGPPGTGKTSFLLNQILRATRDGLSFVALDFKPELHAILASALAKAGYRVLRVNPAASAGDSSAAWNPLDEIGDATALAELAAAMIPIANPADTPFVAAQRDWWTAVLLDAQALGGNLGAAYHTLAGASAPQALLDQLAHSPAEDAARIAARLRAGLFGPKPDPLIAAGLSQAQRALHYLALPGVAAALDHCDFRVRELGTGTQPIALFLQIDETRATALAPVLSLLSTAVLGLLIETAGHRRPVAVFLDELGNLPALPNLPEKLNTLRSREVPVWMYFQSAEQIERRYGRGATDIFFGAADLKLFFRLNDVHTRNLVAALIGTHERDAWSRSTTPGERRVTLTSRRERVNVIEPHELGELKDGEIVCLYRTAAARGIAPRHYMDFPAFQR